MTIFSLEAALPPVPRHNRRVHKSGVTPKARTRPHHQEAGPLAASPSGLSPHPADNNPPPALHWNVREPQYVDEGLHEREVEKVLARVALPSLRAEGDDTLDVNV